MENENYPDNATEDTACTNKQSSNKEVTNVLDGAGSTLVYDGDGNVSEYEKEQITNVLISDRIVDIEKKHYFVSFKNLERIEIPTHVRSIRNNCFENCSKLNDVTFIPTSQLISIGDETFRNCHSLKVMNIPNAVETIGINAFHRCRALTCIKLSNTKLSAIEKGVFQYCVSLTEVVLPMSIKEISSNAFFCCGSLLSIYMPDTVEKIESRAFYNCPSLRFINILTSSEQKQLLDSAYVPPRRDVSEEEYSTDMDFNNRLPSSIKYVGTSSFYKCSGLISLDLSRSNVEIAPLTFAFSNSLRCITLPESLQEISRYTFKFCTALQKVNFPKSLRKIGAEAFERCWTLERIEFPQNDGSLQIIEEKAFSCCRNVTGPIVLPDTIQEIGEMSFYGCTRLTHVTFSPDCPLKEISKFLFAKCTNLTSIELPMNLQKIRPCAFQSCSALTSINFPTQLDYFISSSSPFQSQGITKIPALVDGVGWNAFEGCSKALSSMIDTNAIHFGCDLARGGKRFLLRHNNKYTTSKEGTGSSSSSLLSYLPSLWPLILHRVLNEMDLPTNEICSNYNNNGNDVIKDDRKLYTNANPLVRRASVVFYLMIHGVAMEY